MALPASHRGGCHRRTRITVPTATGRGRPWPGSLRALPAPALAHRAPRARDTPPPRGTCRQAGAAKGAGRACPHLFNSFPLTPWCRDGQSRTQTLVRHGWAARVRFAVSSPVRARYGHSAAQRACAAACGGAPASRPQGRPFEWVRHWPVPQSLTVWR